MLLKQGQPNLNLRLPPKGNMRPRWGIKAYLVFKVMDPEYRYKILISDIKGRVFTDKIIGYVKTIDEAKEEVRHYGAMGLQARAKDMKTGKFL